MQTFRREAAGGGARLAAGGAGGAATAAGAGGKAEHAASAALSGRGSLWLQIIGGVLLLTMIYLLVAGKGAEAFGKLTSAIAGGVEAFIAPVDPIAKLESALGATPVSAGASSSGPSPSLAAGTAVSSGGNPGPSAGGKAAPAPSSITLPKTTGLPSANLLEKLLQLRATSGKQVKEGRLTKAGAISREEQLIPRAKYPAFYHGKA